MEGISDALAEYIVSTLIPGSDALTAAEQPLV